MLNLQGHGYHLAVSSPKVTCCTSSGPVSCCYPKVSHRHFLNPWSGCLCSGCCPTFATLSFRRKRDAARSTVVCKVADSSCFLPPEPGMFLNVLLFVNRCLTCQPCRPHPVVGHHAHAVLTCLGPWPAECPNFIPTAQWLPLEGLVAAESISLSSHHPGKRFTPWGGLLFASGVRAPFPAKPSKSSGTSPVVLLKYSHMAFLTIIALSRFM